MLRQILNTAVRGGDIFNRPSSTGDVLKLTTLAVTTRANRDDRPSVAPPSGIDARSPSARSARRMARHALITAIQVAEAQAAATTPAASALHDPENRRILPPPSPGTFPRSDILSLPQHVTDGECTGGGIQPRQVYQRPEDLRLLSFVDTRAHGPHDSGERRGR